MLWYIQSWFLWSRFDGGFILHVCFAIFWHQKREENSITHHISPLLTPSQLGCACAMLSPHPYHSEETKNRTAFFSDVVFMQLFRRFLAAFWHVSFCQQPVGNLQETCGKLIRNPILRGAVVEVWWFFLPENSLKPPSKLHQNCTTCFLIFKNQSGTQFFKATYAMLLQKLMEQNIHFPYPPNHHISSCWLYDIIIYDMYWYVYMSLWRLSIWLLAFIEILYWMWLYFQLMW